MKRITDLFEEIYDSELEGLDIQKQLCEEEELSREETERIFEKVCQKTEHFRTQKTRKFSKKNGSRTAGSGITAGYNYCSS